MVERHLAKVNVAGSNLVSRSKILRTVFLWRYSQVVRPGSAKPLSPGSNPGGASKNRLGARQGDYNIIKPCPSGGIGRRKGLKIFGRKKLTLF